MTNETPAVPAEPRPEGSPTAATPVVAKEVGGTPAVGASAVAPVAAVTQVAAPSPAAPVGEHGVPDLPADLEPTPEGGLTAAEATARQARGLGNDVKIATGRTYAEILRDNVLQPVNILLGVICVVLAALGLYGDAAVTIVLVLVNIVVGLVQEMRAKRSLDRLSVLTRPTATVIRDGAEITLDPREVVLGDLLVARRGDQLLLDGKVSEGTFAGGRVAAHGGVGPDAQGGRLRGALGQLLRRRRGPLRRHAGRRGDVRQPADGGRTGIPRAIRTPLQQDVARVLRGMSLLVLVAAVPVLIRLYQRERRAAGDRDGARGGGARGAHPAGPGGHDHGHVCHGHRPAGRPEGAHPALQRGRVDEPGERPVPRQDRDPHDARDRGGGGPRDHPASRSWLAGLGRSWPRRRSRTGRRTPSGSGFRTATR